MHFPSGTKVSEPKGGMHLWVVLPEGPSVVDLRREAAMDGLAFAPGPLFFPDGRGTNCMRLNFSTHAPDVTREAISRLGAIIRQLPSCKKEAP